MRIRPSATARSRGAFLVMAGVVAAVMGAGAVRSLPRTAAPKAPPAMLVARIPARPPGAMAGRQLVDRIADLDPVHRRQVVLDQLLAGNIPDHLRRLKAVEVSSPDARGAGHHAVIWVMPDYLAVGSDDDFVRMPMGLYSAVTVARAFGFVLPTRKMVDAIHRQADVRLTPRPMAPGPWMTSPAYILRHNQIIERQLAGRPRGLLVSGHKKDLVLTDRLARRARKVAIYGWEYADGTPIQPLSTVHEGRYADYSHGIRLVSATVLIDGAPRSVFDVLEDPVLASTLSYEGTIDNARQIMSLPFSPRAAPTPVAATPDPAQAR